MAGVLGALTGPAAAQAAGCHDETAHLHRRSTIRDLAPGRSTYPGSRVLTLRRSRGTLPYDEGGQVLSSGYGGTGLGTFAPGGFNGPYPYGPAGGLAVYSPGAFGPGPRIITIPEGYGE